MTSQIRLDPFRHGPLYQHMANPSAGDVFYVNTAAAGALDTNDGRTPETAFLTIDNAVGQCTAAGDDYIFVVGHDYASETYPIEVDVSNIHIIGHPLAAEPNVRIVPQSDVDAMTVTASHVEIAGFHFYNAADGYTNKMADVSGRGFWFHHNYVSWIFWGYDGLWFEGANASNPLIENNFFGAHRLEHWHVTCAPTSNRCVIRNNTFIQDGYDTSAMCIKMDGNNRNQITDNFFMVADLAAGEAITTSASATGFAMGNIAAQGKIAMNNIPWVDGGSFSWAGNYITDVTADLALKMPA